jgi:endoglucanase
METTHWVPAGLDFQPYQKIMDLTKRLGYNAIRLAISNQMVEQDPIVTRYIAKNPQFRGKHALQVLDAIVDYARKIGLKIILDDQRSAAATDQAIGYLQEGLWYTPQYPQSAWIHDWVSLARRYRSNPAVIGFDLRNEPHTDGPGPWTLATYRNQGSTWGPDPYTGNDDPASDWRLAAEAAGNAVLAVNPHLLMFVEGVQLYPDASRPSGVDSYWWAGILSPVRYYPIVFKVPHQLVYSPHEYGPMKVNFYWFQGMTYQSMKQVWDKKWAFILNNRHAKYTAPVWIGEVGTCTDHMWCIDDRQQGNQAQWFHFFLRFLRNHPNVGWDIWALNGTNAKDEPANNGILNSEWNGVANQALQSDLQSIQRR